MTNDLEKILPSFFATAKRDVVARYIAGAAAGGIVGWAAGWARAHGWYVPDKDVLGMATQAIAGLVFVIVVARLGVNATNKSEIAIVNNTVRAAVTGEVPEAIAARATPAQAAAIEASPTAMVASVPPAPAVKVP